MPELYQGGSCVGCRCEMDVSVVVPVFNAMPHLTDQLQALAAQDTPLLWELVIADNGSTDAYLDAVRSLASGMHSVLVVDAATRRGPAHARNAGAAAARARLLLFCDADDVADRFWVHAMHRAARPNTILAGRLDYDGLNSPAERRWREPLQSSAAPNFYGHPYAMSANMAIPRTLFEEVGGFDESFSNAGGEDVDMPLRAARLGVEVGFVDDAVVSYRLKAGGAPALQQAAAYGAAAPAIFRAHRQALPLPTLVDDIGSVSALAADALRRRLHGEASRTHTWGLRYHAAQTRGLLSEPGYWRPAPTYPWRGRGVDPYTTRLARVADRLGRRISAKLSPPKPGDVPSPWTALDGARATLSVEEQHLLGAGLLSTADVTIEVRRGGRTVYVNPALDPIVADVIATGGYGETEIAAVEAHLREIAPDQGVVVNVGANIGTTAIALAERGWRVLAIEPVPRAAELLRRNVSANGHDDRIQVVQAAVMPERGTVEMVAGDNLSTSEVRPADRTVDELATPGDVRATVLQVEGLPLIELLSRAALAVSDVAAVWSDTEGSEGAVIAGGAALWTADVPLWVEVRPSALLDQGRITDFCALVQEHFSSFQTLHDLRDGRVRAIDSFREFVDAVGYGRWDFDNVLLRA